MIPSGGVLRCLSRKAASSRKYMATTMELCTQQIYARMGVLDILCAIRAARPHIVLLFKTQERGMRAVISARPLIQVQNGNAAPFSKAVS